MSKRVLYIDDEIDLLELATSFFEEENLPIETCSDFHEAVKRIQGQNYDIVISDAKMPSGSGYEIFKILKADQSFKGKIILVTGNLDGPLEEKEKNYDLVIYKPVKFQELVTTVKNLLV
jgi:DNA-binding response OmpR family regulator